MLLDHNTANNNNNNNNNNNFWINKDSHSGFLGFTFRRENPPAKQLKETTQTYNQALDNVGGDARNNK